MIAVTSPPNAALKDGTPKESSKLINRIISATWAFETSWIIL